jgi:hypothetical protein
MNRYVSTMPKATFIIAALAMTVLTLGTSVAPAWQESGAGETATVADAAVDRPAATEVAIIPARIDVVGEREPRTVFGAVRQFLTRKAQPS